MNDKPTEEPKISVWIILDENATPSAFKKRNDALAVLKKEGCKYVCSLDDTTEIYYRYPLTDDIYLHRVRLQ